MADKSLNAYYRRKYGITEEEYWAIYKAQKGLCYICRKATGKRKRLAVDHSHVTGLVRGLLCSRCNKILGWLEYVGAVSRIAYYLKNPPAQRVLRRLRGRYP